VTGVQTCALPIYINIEIPWKEYDNYPFLMNFFSNNNTICIDSKQNTKNIIEINKDNSCSILFELNYIQIIKIISGDNINHSLKFKFSLLLIQEKFIDIKTCLLENINQFNNNISKPKFNIPMVNNITQEIPLTLEKKIINSPVIRLTLDPNELLNKKKSLNKIEKIDKNDKNKEDTENNNDKNISEYLELKSKLKKVETDEKTMIPILKKEFEDYKNKELEKQLENEFEKELDNDINKNNHNLKKTIKDNNKNKNNKNKNNKNNNNNIKNNINNNIINSIENDLEQELEKMMQ